MADSDGFDQIAQTHMSEDTFSHKAARIFYSNYYCSSFVIIWLAAVRLVFGICVCISTLGILGKLSLRKHAYSNIWKISPPKKTENFQIKNSDIFHISAQNMDCGYSLEPPRRGGSNEYPQSMFYAVIRKIMYTPINPSFTI